MKGAATLFSSASVEWATPQPFFAALNREFRFTLDACATADNAKCRRFFTKADDGLVQTWRGRVWLNPPYGRDIGRWMRKAYESSQAGALVVCLVHARTDTRWFHQYVYGKAEIRFLQGRLVFERPETHAVKRNLHRDSAPFPSMVAIYRPPE